MLDLILTVLTSSWFLFIGYLIYRGYLSRFIGMQLLLLSLLMAAGIEIALIIYVIILESISVIPFLSDLPAILKMVHQTQDGNFVLAISIGLSIALLLYGYYIARVFFNIGKPLGRAHFANGWTMHRAGFFARQGFLLGKSFYGLLRHSGFEPILVVAGTGGGKTRSLVIPNLLTLNDDTIIVTDIKGEVFKKTENYRRKIGNQIIRFEPASGTTQRYNPLAQVRPDHIDEDLDSIFKVLIPDSNDPLWADGSRNIGKMLALYYLLEKQVTPTFQMIYQDICHPEFDANIEVQYEKIKTQRIKILFGKFLSTREKTRRDLLLNIQEYLSSFDSPRLAYATGGNDIDLASLRKIPTTVYLVMPANTQTYGPIVAIFFEQLLQIMTGEPTKEERSITILMDEFANFPKMPSLVRGITFLRSYRIRVCAFVQHIAQLKDVYDEQGKESFLACPLQLAFNITSIEDAKYFSVLAGKNTIRITNTSHSETSSTVATQVHTRELLLAEEVFKLPKNRILVFKNDCVIIRAQKNGHHLLVI